VAGAVLTVAGAVLTNTLSSHHSNEEKIWELRRVACGSILAKLTEVEWVLDNADEYIQQDEMRYFHEDISNKHKEIIANHMISVRKSYTDNYLILSDRFIALFEDFLRSLDDRYSNLLPPEEHEKFAVAVRTVRPKLLQQARSEIPLRGSSLWERICAGCHKR
jgi:hypothetical protein